MARGLSGSRKKFEPPVGNGTVGGQVDLECGHPAKGSPMITHPIRGDQWFCGHGCGFQTRAKKKRAA